MINIAFRNLVKASTSLSVRRNQHSKHMTIAASFACRSMLWRGYQALLRLSPRTKRVKALQWRINHILTLTFGAWVRFSATSRQDREDNLKASEFYEQFLLSRGLDKCKTLVSRKQCAFSAESLAELFHRLLSFKRYLLIFKNQRQRQRQRQNVVFTERQRYLIFEESPELQCFLTKKAKLSALTCFTRLHLKSAKKNSKSKRSFQVCWYNNIMYVVDVFIPCNCLSMNMFCVNDFLLIDVYINLCCLYIFHSVAILLLLDKKRIYCLASKKRGKDL